jgi:hypothetical protein
MGASSKNHHIVKKQRTECKYMRWGMGVGVGENMGYL